MAARDDSVEEPIARAEDAHGAGRPEDGGGDLPRAVHRATLLDHPVLAAAAIEGGRIRRSNAAWGRLFAFPADVSVESHVAALFPDGQGADRFEKALAARLAASSDGAAHATLDHVLARRDGSTFVGEVFVWVDRAVPGQRTLSGDAVWQVRDVTAERALHDELRELEEYHRELARNQWGMTLVIDRKGRVSYASPSIETLLGYRVAEVLGEPLATMLDGKHNGDAEQWLRAASRKHGEAEPGQDGFRLHVVDAEGRRRVLACRPRNCFGVPRIAGMVVHARDVTAEVDDEKRFADDSARGVRLRASLASLAGATPHGFDARIAALLEDALVELDAGLVAMWTDDTNGGWRPDFVVRSPRVDTAAAPPPLLSLVADPLEAIDAAAGLPLVVEDVSCDPLAVDARDAWSAANVAAAIEVPVFVDGRTVAWLAVGHEAPRVWAPTEIDFVAAVAFLASAAFAARGRAPANDGAVVSDPLDALTGLPGRVAARRRLAEIADHPTNADAAFVAVVDLDRLAESNDRHGYDVGDALLVHAARQLLAADQREGFAARIGGDEFLVVLTGIDRTAAEAAIETMLARIAAPAGDGLPRICASVGVARLSIDGPDAESWWREADVAMREAKARGRGQAVFFHPRMSATIASRHALGDEIGEALDGDEFGLFYQPQIGLATGRLVGFEAFLRWQHPRRGLLLPEAFIDAATERGLIDALTRRVFDRVCERIGQWQRLGFPEVPVSVNISGQQFHDRRLPAVVASALLRSGLPARLLVLEIIEKNFLIDEADTERVVKELARLGVRVSIGSFGLGHVSLKSLRSLGVSQIKLNRGFVEGLPDDAESAIVVDAAIAIARRLKCQVVAEGVETRAQFERLREIGCDAAQGFFFGAPLAADEIAAFVSTNREHPVR